MTKRVIDINCDMGERPEALYDGSEEELMKLITSANIACGFHAGDESMMEESVHLAMKYNVGIGAHPGYPDRAHFGRVSMKLPADELSDLVYEQIRTLGAIARMHGVDLIHVKPHGALYTDAAQDRSAAEAIAEGVTRWSKELMLIGFAGSMMLDVWKEKGLSVVPEAFADRTYEKEGSLRSRKFSDALITDPSLAAQQALTIATNEGVLTNVGTKLRIHANTICVHSDTTGSIDIVKRVRQRLEDAGIIVQCLKSS
jgi:UPF0271 protein